MTRGVRLGCTVAVLALVGGGAALYLTLGAATASLLLFAAVLVSVLGAAPVVFGMVTRARDERLSREEEERERRGG